MSMGMDPIDIVKAVIPTLDEVQKQELRDLLQVELPPPCKKTGHKFKLIDHIEPTWYEAWNGAKPFDKVFCEKCGTVSYLY
jgi:hypothetical protein